MKNKLLLAISLSAVSLSVSSSSLFDIPLAKKCYAVSQELVKLEEAQTISQCTSKIHNAKYNTESAALSIADDSSWLSKASLDTAITSLRHAQVYGCVDEEKIVAAELKLLDIKSLIK